MGQVVEHRKEFITISDTETYKRCRVQLHAKGVVLRDEIEGARIKTKSQQICRTDELLVAEIDAKVGGFGLVPGVLDGAIVSSHYFLFTADRSQLDPTFLGYYVRTPHFRDQVKAQGSTNYAAIRPHHVLDYVIPLPAMDEQRRIVAKIDQLAAKIDEAQSLRTEVSSGCDALCRSILENADATPTPMAELVRWRKPDVDVEPADRYQFAGVYCFGRGVFRSNIKSGLDFSYKSLTRLRSGDFVYPKLMAWEGALGIVPPECDGCVVSPEFPVFEVHADRVLPEVLDTHFRSPVVWPRLSGASTGTNVRRRRLNPKDFLKYEFPLPSRRDQEVLYRVRSPVDRLKELQQKSSTELDALLPSILDKAFKGEL